MKRLLLVLLFATAAAAAAQTADIATSIEITSMPTPPRPGDIVTWRATVRNNGPDAATSVVFRSTLTFNRTCTDQILAILAAGESRTVDCSLPLPEETSGVIEVLGASQDVIDPDLQNNHTRFGFELSTPPDLFINTFPPQVVDAGLPFELRVFYGNLAKTTATGVEIQIQIPGLGSVLKMPENCTASGQLITCRIGDVAGGPSRLDFTLVAPDQSAQRLQVAAAIYGAESDLEPETNYAERATTTYRTFFVTTTADDGHGSLRQALHDANAGCRDPNPPCKIAFRILNAGTKWLTIRPESPLPVVNVPVAIDGAVQAAYISDSNPDGPEIEISGERVREGSGIQSSQVCLIVRGLTINGFPASGIHLGGGGCSEQQIVEGNYIGTDPTGMRAIPNMRGITSTGPWGGDPSPIRNNIISGNTRSGLFIHSGEFRIEKNIIGLTRDLKSGLGNGASGIYLGPESNGTDVFDNYIGFNQHFGISLDRGAGYRSIRGNSFQANWNLAIDYGLDGPTADVPDFSTSDRPVRRPTIGLAFYDTAVNKTLIVGVTETNPDRHQVWVDLYANDEPDDSGYGEGQYFLGTTQADSDGHFRFVIDGRPPGPWIAATTTRVNIIGFGRAPEPEGIHGSGLVSTTSEFSRTVFVVE